MNVITVTGNATKDVALTYNQNGTAFSNGTIAVQRDFKNQAGEYETDFINFKSIGKISEVLANYIRKGDRFGITGRLQIDRVEKDGKAEYYANIIVNSFDFPQRRNENNQSNTNTPRQQQNGNQAENNPFEAPGQKPSFNDDPFGGTSKTLDITDDMLPF